MYLDFFKIYLCSAHAFAVFAAANLDNHPAKVGNNMERVKNNYRMQAFFNGLDKGDSQFHATTSMCLHRLCLLLTD